LLSDDYNHSTTKVKDLKVEVKELKNKLIDLTLLKKDNYKTSKENHDIKANLGRLTLEHSASRERLRNVEQVFTDAKSDINKEHKIFIEILKSL